MTWQGVQFVRFCDCYDIVDCPERRVYGEMNNPMGHTAKYFRVRVEERILKRSFPLW